MKRNLLIAFSFLISATLFSQGTILNFTVVPSSPTTADYVKVYAELQFSSGSCPVYNQGISTVGTTTDAYALHCLGMLPYICNTTDTFNLGYLPAGNNLFRLTLSSGFGGTPCTPGIVPDDTASVMFYVAQYVGILNPDAYSDKITLYPNPFSESTTLRINTDLKINDNVFKIFNVLGETVRTIENIHEKELVLNRDELSNGIYFYQLRVEGGVVAEGRIIIK